MLYFLQYSPPQVKTCFGCGQLLKPEGKIGQPPYDMVVVSNAQRPFYNRTTGQIQERPGNVYYHVNTGCLKRRQTYFIALQVQLHSIRSMLTPVHHLCLREFGLVL